MTNDITGCFLGYDPGGTGDKRGKKGLGGNGVAALRVVSGVVVDRQTCSRRNATESWKWFEQAIEEKKYGRVLGMGVDTLTYWGCEDNGRREADFYLRNEYNAVHPSVMSPSRLSGAMLLPGAIVLLRLRARDQAFYVTETHPKVLFHALTDKEKIYKEVDLDKRNGWLGEIMGMADRKPACSDDHQWDALISAWAAYRGYASKRGRAHWRNLVDEQEKSKEGQHKSEIVYPAGCVEYRWPNNEEIEGCRPALDLLDGA